MATLEEFKALRDGVPAEVQAELYRLITADPEASFKRMVEIAAEKGMTLTVEEVKGFLKQMDEDQELEGAAGGWFATWRSDQDDEHVGRLRGCQEEAHDEPWGRCPGMRPMPKWLFGGSPQSA